MLPAATASRPPACSSAASRVVVLVFPLVPVTASTGTRANRQASSISLQTGMPRRMPAAITGLAGGTPGGTHPASAPAAAPPRPPPPAGGGGAPPRLGDPDLDARSHEEPGGRSTGAAEAHDGGPAERQDRLGHPTPPRAMKSA